MTLGIMPVAGLPLPFVSYGGSSMFAVWVADRAAAVDQGAAADVGLSAG